MLRNYLRRLTPHVSQGRTHDGVRRAFAGRGGDDYLASPDLEDIVTDGRAELVGEVTQADADLRQFLATRLLTLFATPSFLEALSAHLPPDAASQARVPILRDRIRLMARAYL